MTVKVAQGAVAVGLAVGVGGFAVASERGLGQDAEADALVRPVLSPDALRERREAAQVAATAVAEAVDARTAAEASAVSSPHFTSLDQAVAELDSALAATQLSQPVVTQLTPDEAQQELPLVVVTQDPAVELATQAASNDSVVEKSAVPDVTALDSPTEATGPTPESTTSTADSSVFETTTEVDDPAAASLRSAAERVETLTRQMRLVTQLADQAAAEEAARVAAEQEAQRQAEELAAAAAEAERKAAQAASLDAYANGQIPSSALCELSFASGHQLRCDAAEALEALNVAYVERFGSDMPVSDSYRSYSAQVACQAAKGSLCAVPGTSNHGTGIAVDLGGKLSSFGTTEHTWLLENAQTFGWDLPSWARATGSKPEPWHWEFTS